jgi:hypothetical protein
MINTHEFARPVRRSLLQREMFCGVPQMGLLLLFIMAVVFIYGLRLWFMIPVIIEAISKCQILKLLLMKSAYFAILHSKIAKYARDNFKITNFEIISIILFLVMRALSEKDPWLIDIVLESISQKDLFLP